MRALDIRIHGRWRRWLATDDGRIVLRIEGNLIRIVRWQAKQRATRRKA